jgi:DNA processing protein
VSELPARQCDLVASSTACRDCVQHGWLLSALSERLDYHRHDAFKLAALLALSDEELLAAVAGEAQAAMRARLAEPDRHRVPERPPTNRICRHDPGFPRSLRALASAPRLLHVSGGSRTLGELLAGPTVAIVGSRSASDYGMELGWALGRGLAAAGVTVIGGLADGIATAAHTGALQVEGPTLTVVPGGLDVCYPAARGELYARLRRDGLALAELPRGSAVRRWCHPARARIVAGLAQVLVVVEARERTADLTHATFARAANRIVAAVPGRVNSPLAAGTNALLLEGAPLIRGPQDVLDLLYIASDTRPQRPEPRLPQRLRALLERVQSGEDTLGKLSRRGGHHQDLLVGLAELEVLGALGRGDGGRYVPSVKFLAG